MRHSPLAWFSLLALVLATLPPGSAVRPAQAQAPVPVTYDAATNTVIVGEEYDPTDPAEAPYVGYPSHPSAPKTPITIPQIAAILNNPALLQNQGGGAWLLKANMTVQQTARLEATHATLSWLRIDSTPVISPSYHRLYADGGHLLIQGIQVTSWNASTNSVDTNYADGRSFLVAKHGGRMDVLNAEVSHLGWAPGEPSGLSWHRRATDSEPATGPTGSILNSNIHDNYFGQYSNEGYGLVVKNSEFHHNVVYGFDPHDYSTGFEVAYNRVYNNGKHGIIFSRGCINNWIHHNEVYGNAEHGIMLDRGSNSNTISDNLVYGNRDGIAIFQSSDNLVQGNVSRDNERGVRINATFDPDDPFDGISTNNMVISNTIVNNSQYGVYLYQRADENTIENNLVSGNVANGVYVKTGGNLVRRNVIRANDNGITIVGTEPYTPGDVPPAGEPGRGNVVQGNTIEDNDGVGIQFKGGDEALIGIDASAPNPADGNLIRTNGTHGISFDAASNNNVVEGNTIHANGVDGVLTKGVGSVRNKITRNSITANGRIGINVDDGANNGILPPVVASAPGASTVTGTAAPNVRIEVYRDPGGQGHVYKGATAANSQGNWSFTLPADDNPQDGPVTAIAIDDAGNTSAFSGNLAGGATASLGAGRNGELTIYISGPGATVALPDIHSALQAISPTVPLLENQGNGVWQANASLFVNRGVTLTLKSPVVTWLKLRSEPSGVRVASPVVTSTPDYESFVTLRTYSGAILIDGVRVTSWNPVASTYDSDLSNGRAYVLAKYAARMDIKNAEMSYLGFSGGESYGVSWRDINDSDNPGVLLTRVTGQVISSTFSHNYYGVYTFQAGNMMFRGNRLHHNISYGFDPHDYSHHFVIEDNEAYQNGNHGFIISRGCNNFVFRRNESYDNHYTVDSADRLAHGFMIDPGSPHSSFPRAASHDNLLENNQAWGNDGYGLRIVGSNNNTIRNNIFRDNLQGVTLEQGSAGNLVRDNTITRSGLYGIYLIGGANGNTIEGNTVTASGKHGIYVKTASNTMAENTVTDNGSWDAGVRVGSGIAFLKETDVAAAVEDLRLPGAAISLAASDPELLGSPWLAGDVTGNAVTGNAVARNFDDGIELKNAVGTTVEDNVFEGNTANGVYLASGATGSLIRRNTIKGNWGYGIKANGADVVGNTWTENRVFDNALGGIVNTGGANDGIKPPTISQQGLGVTGTARPGAVVEIYSDTDRQGHYFEGRTIADSSGRYSFVAAQPWQAPNLNATATDPAGNSSGFTYNVGEPIGSNRVYLPIISR